jgi:hypothetical protein
LTDYHCTTNYLIRISGYMFRPLRGRLQTVQTRKIQRFTYKHHFKGQTVFWALVLYVVQRHSVCATRETASTRHRGIFGCLLLVFYIPSHPPDDGTVVYRNMLGLLVNFYKQLKFLCTCWSVVLLF